MSIQIPTGRPSLHRKYVTSTGEKRGQKWEAGSRNESAKHEVEWGEKDKTHRSYTKQRSDNSK
jgi:hypothetical protein